MLFSVFFISFVFAQSIADEKSNQEVVPSSLTPRPVDNSSRPDDSKCSNAASCVPIRQCPELFNLYKQPGKLSQSQQESLNCGFGFVCCHRCGESIYIRNVRTVGGLREKLGQWPWMAALFGFRNDYPYKGQGIIFICGGLLISREWILTAGHCVPKHVKLRHVRLGDLNLNPSVKDGATPIDIKIEEIIRHPEYSEKPLQNDIALLRLRKPVEYTEHILPICLHTDKKYLNNTYYDQKIAMVAGWGRTEYYGGSFSYDLLDAELYVQPTPECKSNYTEFIQNETLIMDEKVLCAHAPGKDACQGDSGSPLMFKEDDSWYLGGIVSKDFGCAFEEYAGIYTKVAPFADWIKEKTGLNL